MTKAIRIAAALAAMLACGCATTPKGAWEGCRVAVLGDMFELGTRSEEFHERVLSRAATLPIDVVMPVGEAMTTAAARISSASFAAPCADAAAAHAALDELLRPGDAVLLKASHGMHLGKDFK